MNADEVVVAVAKAMCAIEARHSRTLDEAIYLRDKWRRYVYEAQRLIDEIQDYSLVVVSDDGEVDSINPRYLWSEPCAQCRGGDDE